MCPHLFNVSVIGISYFLTNVCMLYNYAGDNSIHKLIRQNMDNMKEVTS